MATNRRPLGLLSIVLIWISFWSAIYRPAASAQRPSRNVNGIVSDQHQVPLKGAIVQLRDLDSDGVISYITGVDGRYSFRRLVGDSDYRIWAKVHGHRSKVKTLSIFDSGTPKTINFVISFQ
jgi:hypothetical protein